ncbi:MAG: carboxymuconolactone decarboxylase family protein [Rhodospirillales bacterium]|nr:carboxymuconolactone decarboxylase family protein [Rhodospirillales bacterium]MBT7942159.1 carboxymuconolactone decarboxylase family protein [Alphaproteobacteria bacterium]
MPRLPELDPAALTPEQKQVHDSITNGPRGGVRGPFAALLHHPGVAEHVQAMGINLRFDGVLPGHLRELAILTTARFWGAEYEWNSHAPIAEKEGLSLDVIDAIAENRTPYFSSDAEKVVSTFCSELHQDHHVSDATYAVATSALSHEGVIELTALCGYYTLISMTLNTFQVLPAEGATKFD